jgi:hypothetical protein
MTASPILFADVDGVLNSFESQTWGTAPRALLLPECVKHFNSIIEATEAKIVLSSSWRYYILQDNMTLLGFEHLLRSHGVRGSLIGCTCHDDEADERGEQIRLWKKANLEPFQPYVVIDDFDDGISSRGLRFVQTNGAVGLTEADARRAIGLIERQKIEL